MPLEIRELNIRVQVGQPSAAGSTSAAATSPDSSDTQARDELVRECLDEVLRVLDAKKER